MCTYFDKVVDGIDVFSVGKQQLWDWCSYNGREFTGWLPEHTSVISYADSLRKGIYLVVELPAVFGRVLKPQLIASCTSLKSAVGLALTYDEYRLLACPYGSEYGCDYEIWHVVDDGDLWQAWDHDAELSRIDVPVIVDSWNDEDSSGRTYGEQLIFCFVPSVGQCVAFLLCFGPDGDRYYAPNDWQSLQPRSFDQLVDYDFLPIDEFADDFAELISIGLLPDDFPVDLRVGGDVGVTC